MWSLATFLCPAQSPGLSTTTYWAMAAVASTLFIVSIRLHELGHALQARRDGVPIEGITLWLFGGVAKFKGMYPSARVEFRIAIAGPIVSAVVAATLLAGAILAAMPAALGGVWDARHTTYAVVENGGRVAGLLPFRCVAEIPRREWDERRVRDCMVPRERVRSCAARCA